MTAHVPAARNPAVVVVMPVRDAAEFLRPALDSMLAQTFTDFELMAVDDASSDATPDILADYAARDGRVRVLRNETPLGCAGACNRAIAASRAPLIARMDADDVSDPERFRKQLDFLQTHPRTGILGTAMRYLTSEEPQVQEDIVQDSEGLKCRFLFASPFNHPTVMFYKELVDKYHLRYDAQYLHAEDYALWAALLDKTEFSNLDEPLLDYRLTEEQVSQKHRPQQIASVMKVQEKIIHRIGIQPSQEEIALQQSLFIEEYGTDSGYLSAVESWLQKLRQANDSSSFFDRDTFQYQLGKTWFQVCTTLASKGVRTQKKYQSSVLSEWYLPPPGYLLKFRLKKWLR